MTDKQEKSYHIIGFEAENVKRLKAVSLSPEGNVIEITGENGMGKSSLLDAIEIALGGADSIPAVPIRLGEETARIIVTMNGLTVKRTFKAKEEGGYTTAIVVETDEGFRAQKPQNVLSALIGDLTFDPLAFTRMKPTDQLDVLKRFVNGFDFDAEAKDRRDTFEKRTTVNRQIKEGKAQVAGINIPDDTPSELVDVSVLVAELEDVGTHNADIEKRKANRERVRSDISAKIAGAERAKQQAADLRRQADALDQDAADLLKDAEAYRDKLDAAGQLPESKDPSEVRAKIDAANAINEQVRRRQSRDALIAQVAALEEHAKQLTADIEASDVRKSDAIAEAKLPVEGIGFDDTGVTLNNLPFGQASSAEQIKAATALCMAANPKLRVILIRDGSLLDKHSFQILSEMAAANEFQVFVEVVESDRANAIVIEDGEIKPKFLEAAE